MRRNQFPTLGLAEAVTRGSVATFSRPKIARVWRGFVPTHETEAYSRYLGEQGLERFSSIPGNRGAEMWRRVDGDRTEFIVISYWDSTEEIRNFTGPDWEKVKALPDDPKYLIGPPANVTHFEIVVGLP